MLRPYNDIAVASSVRTSGSKGVWGLCPQPGVEPLHPVLNQREFDSAISAPRRGAEMAQNRASRFAEGTILRVRRTHVKSDGYSYSIFLENRFSPAKLG